MGIMGIMGMGWVIPCVCVFGRLDVGCWIRSEVEIGGLYDVPLSWWGLFSGPLISILGTW